MPESIPSGLGPACLGLLESGECALATVPDGIPGSLIPITSLKRFALSQRKNYATTGRASSIPTISTNASKRFALYLEKTERLQGRLFHCSLRSIRQQRYPRASSAFKSSHHGGH